MPHQLFVACGQLVLAPLDTDAVWDASAPDAADALAQVVTDGRALIVRTGIDMGTVSVAVAGGDAEPPPDGEGREGRDERGEREEWEESATLRMRVETGLRLSSPTVDNDLWTDVFTPVRPGWHTVSVAARGRAARPGDVLEPSDHPVEWYEVRLVGPVDDV